MFSEGHLIANHSRSHADLSLMTNEDIVALELDPTSRAVEKLTGEYPMMMRPPMDPCGPIRQFSYASWGGTLYAGLWILLTGTVIATPLIRL